MWKSFILEAASTSSDVCVAGSYHQPSNVSPIFPPWVACSVRNKRNISMLHLWEWLTLNEQVGSVKGGIAPNLVLLFIQGRRGGMCKQKMVSYNVWLCGRVAVVATEDAEGEWALPWWEETLIVPANRLDVWLVDGAPVLHPVAKVLEAHICIRRVVITAKMWRKETLFLLLLWNCICCDGIE